VDDVNAEIGKDRNRYENMMETHREGERNAEGESLLYMCNRNYWVNGSSWFQSRSDRIACDSWDGKFGTIIDNFIMTRNLWNILNDVKGIPSKSFRSRSQNPYCRLQKDNGWKTKRKKLKYVCQKIRTIKKNA
jgi:hypothetical protein